MAGRWSGFRQGLPVFRRVIGTKDKLVACQITQVLGPRPSRQSDCVISIFRRSLTSGIYLTANAAEGVNMDPSAATALGTLFENKPGLCFENHASTVKHHNFSDFSRQIFTKLITISYTQSKQNKCFFRFDPSGILIKYEGKVVIDVGVPKTQVTADSSIYEDRVIGPFAGLLYLLHLKQLRKDPMLGRIGKDQIYKEILDLLHGALLGKWWNSLEDILSHPLFWSVNKKIAAIACANIWMNAAKANISHEISNVQARVRSVNDKAFQLEYDKHVFFLYEYTVREIAKGEYDVRFTGIPKDWKIEFSGLTFGTGYRFGTGIGIEVHADKVRFIRNLIMHFGDLSFDAYVKTLDIPTKQVAVIQLDRVFSFSLSIYHTLRQLGADMVEIIDFKFTKF